MSFRTISGSLQVPPLIIRQTRGWQSLLVAIGAGLLGFVHSGVLAHKLIDGLIPAAPAFAASGLFCVIMGVLVFLWPARLSLAPDGLAFQSIFSNRRIPWSMIQGFAVWRFRNKPRGLRILLTDNGAFDLPSGWPLPPADLAKQIGQAKRYWNG
ncbi:MAG: hypothetical protein P4L11_07575 [Geothrix sp.]|nr:hypothetical protein [Geothrix sp.]